MANKRAGRASKYTPDRVERFLYAISVGATRGLACAHAGWSEDGLAIYLRKYPEFAESVAKAEGGVAIDSLNTVRAAILAGNWKAAMRFLATRFPHDYGRIAVDANITGNVTVNLSIAEVQKRGND